jgi:8-amino-7-oxononanoate synthase
MNAFPKSLSDKLLLRSETNALRSLSSSTAAVDFASNDYLGFSKAKVIFDDAHAYMLQHGVHINGAAGSRLISGNHRLYDVAEEYLCSYHQSESALIFNSGYDANIGFFSSVPQKGDVVLYDEYIHASIRDGIRLSYASAYKYNHNSIQGLQKSLERYKDVIADGNEIYVVTESVFSMDGDSPDLEAVVKLCTTYKCRLIVDEAHALGVFGAGLLQSKGLHQNVFARIITFGKAMGCHGAAVLGPQPLKQYLVNFSRSFIYTTGLPPHSLATLLVAYNYLEADNEAVTALHYNISFFKEEVERLKLREYFIHSHSAIHCAVVPGNEKVKNISSVLQDHGFNVKAILSPTVPQGQERLRFCLHSYTAAEQITNVLTILKANL